MVVLIAVPTFESVSPDTFKSIYGLDCGGHDTLFDFVRGYDCARARNHIGHLAQYEEADYVLMVDSDIVLPPDALVNLLDPAADVCCGYYVRKGGEADTTCAFKLNRPDGKPYGDYTVEGCYTLGELHALRDAGQTRVEVHGSGMGCALVRTDVFLEIPYPWFDWVNRNNGKTLSEDMYFCEKCIEEGMKVQVDTRVGCGHLFSKLLGAM